MRAVAMILICLPLFSFQCKKKKDMVKSEVEMNASPDVVPQINIVRSMPSETDHFTVKGLSIDGKILQIEVSYAHGGKNDHTFDLYTNQMMMKSMPPKMNLFLQHNANGDLGKALKTETLFFDLSPIAAPPGRLILLLNKSEYTVELISKKAE